MNWHLNLTDHKLYSKGAADEIFEIGAAGETPSGGTGDRPDGPALGDLYFDTDLNALLYWNGSEWVPVGQEAIALDDLSDVDTTGVTDGMVIVYDQASGEWKPVSPASLAVDVDLKYVPNGDSDGTVTNSAGDDAVIPVAAASDSSAVPPTPGVAGLFTGAEKEKLAGIEAGAQVNAQAGRALSYDTSTSPDTLNADIATDATLGVVKIGDGISIDADGEITADIPPGTVISETPPANPEEGQLWWNSSDDSGRLYVYYDDGNSQQWVEASPQGDALGKGEADGLYLSKVNDDTAAGEITFEGRTTHDNGLTVPGGDYTQTEFGLAENSDAGLFNALWVTTPNGPSVGFRDNGLMQMTPYDLGSTFGIRISGDISSSLTDPNNLGGVTVRPAFVSNPISPLFTAYEATGDRQGGTINTYSGFTSTVNVATGSPATGTHYGFRAEGIVPSTPSTASVNYAYYANYSNKAGSTVYGFYSEGNAPSRFNGQVIADDSLSCGGTSLNPPAGNTVGMAIRSDGQILSYFGNTPSYHYFKRAGDGVILRLGTVGSPNIGQFAVSGGALSVPTASDYRLKNSIADMPSAVDSIKQLRPVTFEMNAAPGYSHNGFIAHEVQAVVPQAVTGQKDALDADGEIEVQGLDMTKLIPVLTKALQEVLQKNEELEARLAALEGA